MKLTNEEFIKLFELDQPYKNANVKKTKYSRYNCLPDGYIFKAGKYKGVSKEQAPSGYIKWFEANVPIEKW